MRTLPLFTAFYCILLLVSCGTQTAVEAPPAAEETAPAPEPTPTVIPPEAKKPAGKSLEEIVAEAPPPAPPEILDTVSLTRKDGAEVIRLQGDLVQGWTEGLARHGVWKTYFEEDGSLRSIETYERGVRQGSSKRWNRRGELLADVTFLHGSPSLARLRCEKEICPVRHESVDEEIWTEFEQGILQHSDRVTRRTKTSTSTVIDLFSSPKQMNLTVSDHLLEPFYVAWPTESPVPVADLSRALKHLPLELFGRIVSASLRDERGWPIGSYDIGVKTESRKDGEKDQIFFLFDSTPPKELGIWAPYGFATYIELGKHVKADLLGIPVDQAGVRSFPVDREMNLNSDRLAEPVRKWPGMWMQGLAMILSATRTDLIAHYFPNDL